MAAANCNNSGHWSGDGEEGSRETPPSFCAARTRLLLPGVDGKELGRIWKKQNGEHDDGGQLSIRLRDAV